MIEKKRLLFGEGLMSPTLTGNKQITIRKYRAGSHDFVKGEVIRGEFKDGLSILLEITADTEKKPLSELTDKKHRKTALRVLTMPSMVLKTITPIWKRQIYQRSFAMKL